MTSQEWTTRCKQAVKLYLEAWAQHDAAAIRGNLEKCWAEAATYTDPATDPVTGIDALTDLILGFGEQFPGATMQPTSGLDLHHNVGRFSWLMTAPSSINVDGVDYDMPLPGVDFVEFDAEGRITSIVGFFG